MWFVFWNWCSLQYLEHTLEGITTQLWWTFCLFATIRYVNIIGPSYITKCEFSYMVLQNYAVCYLSTSVLLWGSKYPGADGSGDSCPPPQKKSHRQWCIPLSSHALHFSAPLTLKRTSTIKTLFVVLLHTNRIEQRKRLT